VFRHVTRTIVLQVGLVSVLLALSTASAFGMPSRDHVYTPRSHPYAVTTPTQPASPVVASNDDGFAWEAFALGIAIPIGAMLLGAAALTVRTGQIPRLRASR
jgi:hypothetical protein